MVLRVAFTCSPLEGISGSVGEIGHAVDIASVLFIRPTGLRNYRRMMCLIDSKLTKRTVGFFHCITYTYATFSGFNILI